MSGWGPNGRSAAVSFTFDNLGEAAHIENGRLAADAPVGSDPSVTLALPAILELLAQRDLRVTFFVEAWNLGVYPDAVRAIADAGHAIGNHGWRHELWYALSAERERELFSSVSAAYEEAGIVIRGFRPPGGKLRPETTAVASQAGYLYVSPLSVPTGLRDGVAVLPIDFDGTDTAYYSERFTRLRRHRPGRGTASPDVLMEGFANVIDAAVEARTSVSLVCHPMHYAEGGVLSAERIAGLGRVLERLAGDERIWFAQPEVIAAWMRDHPEAMAAVESTQAPDWWTPENLYRESPTTA
jgi:peptidoglycan-N-acetylglucosamine deacetylase